MNDYPMLRVIEKHGGWVATLLSLLPFLAGIWLVFTGAPFWWLLLSVVIAVVIFVFVRSYVELVRVMIDMLLPK